MSGPAPAVTGPVTDWVTLTKLLPFVGNGIVWLANPPGSVPGVAPVRSTPNDAFVTRIEVR